MPGPEVEGLAKTNFEQEGQQQEEAVFTRLIHSLITFDVE